MDQIYVLIARQEICDLKARYFLHLDCKRWDAWAALFTDDAILDVSGEFPDAPDPSAHRHRGPAAMVAAVEPGLRGIVTVHHGHTPLIDLTGPDDATGIWAMEDRLFDGRGGRILTGHGHYHESYRRIDGVWRISASRLTRLQRSAG